MVALKRIGLEEERTETTMMGMELRWWLPIMFSDFTWIIFPYLVVSRRATWIRNSALWLIEYTPQFRFHIDVESPT